MTEFNQKKAEKFRATERMEVALREAVLMMLQDYFRSQSADTLTRYLQIIRSYSSTDMGRFPVLPRLGTIANSNRRRKIYCVCSLLTAAILKLHEYANAEPDSEISSQDAEKLVRKLTRMSENLNDWVIAGGVKTGYYLMLGSANAKP